MKESKTSIEFEIPDDWASKYDSQLRRFATLRLRDSNLADDVVQETYIAAYMALHKFRGEGKFLGWLMQILVRKIIDSARRMTRRREVQFQTDSSESQLVSQGLRCQHAPDAIAVRNETQKRIEEYISSSSQEVSELYRLRFRNHLSTAEISDRLKISPGNVWIRTHRLKRELALVVSAT